MSPEKPGKIASVRRIRRVARRLFRYVAPHRVRLAVAAGAAVLFLVFDLVKPWPIKVVVDQVIIGDPWEVLPAWLSGDANRGRLLAASAAALLIFAALAGILGYVRTILLAQAGAHIVSRIRGRLHKRLLALSMGFHGRQTTGDLVVRLTGDVSMMKNLLVEGLFEVIQNIFLAAAMIVVMAFLDWQLTLLAVVIVPPIAWLLVKYGRRIRQVAKGQRKKEGQIAAAVGESLAGMPVIQAYSLEGVATERFEKQNRRSRNAGVAAARLEGAMSRWTEVALAGGTAAILLTGTHRVLAGYLSAGELLVFVSYARMLFKPLRRVVTTSAKLVKSSAGAERILEILETRPDLPVKEDAQPITRARGEITFQGVAFEYGPGRPALAEVDLSIPPGRHVAIVGENGSGKTTLLTLIPRLRDPTRGVVRLDGVDLRDLDLPSLRRQVSIVFQDAVLFDGTILENVHLGRPDAGEKEVLQAAQRAGVTEFASTLPDGLQTRVGEYGGALSGGQRQRVALARALLREAPVVLLDEPATSLDPETAEFVTAEVLEGLAGKTVILVTHRSDGLDRVDEVITLADGRIAGGEA